MEWKAMYAHQGLVLTVVKITIDDRGRYGHQFMGDLKTDQVPRPCIVVSAGKNWEPVLHQLEDGKFYLVLMQWHRHSTGDYDCVACVELSGLGEAKQLSWQVTDEMRDRWEANVLPHEDLQFYAHLTRIDGSQPATEVKRSILLKAEAEHAKLLAQLAETGSLSPAQDAKLIWVATQLHMDLDADIVAVRSRGFRVCSK